MTDRLDYELICSLVVLISQAAVPIERLEAVLVRCYLGACCAHPHQFIAFTRGFYETLAIQNVERPTGNGNKAPLR
jgi:hypothetical protein